MCSRASFKTQLGIRQRNNGATDAQKAEARVLWMAAGGTCLSDVRKAGTIEHVHDVVKNELGGGTFRAVALVHRRTRRARAVSVLSAVAGGSRSPCHAFPLRRSHRTTTALSAFDVPGVVWRKMRRMRDLAAWTTGSALIAAALCCAGCFYEDVTTVTLRDPGGARLSTNDENGARVVLPEGRAAITVDVARGAIKTGRASRARFRLEAVRGGDGSVALRVDTRVALPDGDERVAFGADGAIEQPFALGEVAPPSAFRDPGGLRLPQCLALRKVFTEDSDAVGYDITASPSCSDPSDTRIASMQIETPWSNVVEVRHVSTPNRAISLVAIAVSAALLIPGLMVIALHASATTNVGDGSPALGTLGDLLVGIPALIDLAFLPNLLAPTRTTVLTHGDGLP